MDYRVMKMGGRRLRQIMSLPRLCLNSNRGVAIGVLTDLWLVQVCNLNLKHCGSINMIEPAQLDQVPCLLNK